MQVRRKIEAPHRLHITGLADARQWMRKLGVRHLGTFFVTYEAVNQEMTEDAVRARMQQTLAAMRQSITAGSTATHCTRSGMLRGGAALLGTFQQSGGGLVSSEFSLIIRNALAVAEHNACMGRIVAAPTAGSCGVLPAALLTVADQRQASDDRVLRALFVAGGIGEVTRIRASLSGSTHGCQAEVGAATAMAAAALVDLCGGSPTACDSAAALALSSFLGLVCDPIAGLVEVPCAFRNVAGAVTAVACAEMALAGVRSPVPFDEVVDAMARIGEDMPTSLRETAQGGLAATPTGQKVAAHMKRLWRTAPGR